MALVVKLNNYLHDFSAALWVATLVCGWLLVRARAGRPCECVPKAFRGLTRLFWASFAGVIAFGVVRAIAYAKYEWVDSLGGAQVTLLAVKHVLFAAFVVAGIVWWVRIGRALRAQGAPA